MSLQDRTSSVASVALTSQGRTFAKLLLPTVGNQKDRDREGYQRHNVRTKFREYRYWLLVHT